ncbi:MAG TPA: hypothetical protein DEG76_09135 [Pseudohongiella sp.]|nr:hypothetical protein [Pseudohongiella sp.]
MTAAAALERYWSDDKFEKELKTKIEHMTMRLRKIANGYEKSLIKAKGRGFMQGLECRDGELAGKICRYAFDKGLVIETSGADSQVVKCLCPLTISMDDLNKGLDIVEEAVHSTLAKEHSAAS